MYHEPKHTDEHAKRIEEHESSIDPMTHSAKHESNGEHGKTHSFAMAHLGNEGHGDCEGPMTD